MIYEKIPVALLSTLAAEKNNSTNSVIAKYILTHIQEVKDMGIKDLAVNCHVGTGSISRFCKDIGLTDFIEMKQLIANSEFDFQRIDICEPQTVRFEKWLQHVSHAIYTAVKSINMDKIKSLCEDIRHYNNVLTFGMLKAETAAINLQVDMLMQGVFIDTCMPYSEQLEHIFNADKDTLIIIFSYTGDYFNNPEVMLRAQQLKEPRIWMICSKDEPLPAFVDNAIFFTSKRDQLSHPYQLEAISSIIAQVYSTL